MDYNKAKQILLMHGSGTYDVAGKPLLFEDGFLGSLRPYRGLLEKNFHLVMEALFVVGETIHASAQVDRDLVQSLWTMCTRAYSWGVHPEGMLQRNKLITRTDAQRLERWIGIIEETVLGLLRGCPPHYAIDSYAERILDEGWWDNIVFFIPLMERAISDETRIDQSVVAAALGKLGSKARTALPALYQAAVRRYTWYTPEDRCTEETRAIIKQAIDSIEAAL
jgi:hypothetical protein